MINNLSILLAIAMAFTSCSNNPGNIAEKADSVNDANYDDNLKQGVAPVDKSSTDFLVNAVNGSMTEVRLAKLAREKGTGGKIKDYAGMIINDHGVLNEQLKAVSSKLHVALPPSPDKEVQTKFQSLDKHRRKSFDKNFLDMMIKQHEKTVQLFERASKNVNNTEVKTLIDNALPQLNKHLDSARVLKKMYK